MATEKPKTDGLIPFRPYPEDIAILNELEKVTGWNRSTIIRNALRISILLTRSIPILGLCEKVYVNVVLPQYRRQQNPQSVYTDPKNVLTKDRK